MRKKRVDQVYMREVLQYHWSFEKNEELNAYISVKQIEQMTSPISRMACGKKTVVMDKDYAILEYTPIDEKFNVRVFINSQNRILGYYFDITQGNYLDEDSVPYYDDAYLDVTCSVLPTGDLYHVATDDEDELDEALREGKITQQAYDEIWATTKALINTLENNTNRFVQRGTSDYLRMKDLSLLKTR